MWKNSAGKHVLRDVAKGPLRDRKRDENVFKFTHEKSRTPNRNKIRFNEYLVADSRKNTCSVMLTQAAK
jgi:ribosomal protein S24E